MRRRGGNGQVAAGAAVAARRQLPAAGAVDRDRHALVALRVERLEHRAGRGEGDLVLARASAHEDGHAQAAAHRVAEVVAVCVVSVNVVSVKVVSVKVVSVVAVAACPTYAPTKIVTVDLGPA